MLLLWQTWFACDYVPCRAVQKRKITPQGVLAKGKSMEIFGDSHPRFVARLPPLWLEIGDTDLSDCFCRLKAPNSDKPTYQY